MQFTVLHCVPLYGFNHVNLLRAVSDLTIGELKMSLPIRQNCTSEIIESGTSPHRTFTSIFYNEDGSMDSFDGKDWQNFPNQLSQGEITTLFGTPTATH